MIDGYRDRRRRDGYTDREEEEEEEEEKKLFTSLRTKKCSIEKHYLTHQVQILSFHSRVLQ